MNINPISELKKQLRDGKSQKELAAAMKISQGYLSDLLNGNRDAGEKVLKYLGLKVVYERR